MSITDTKVMKITKKKGATMRTIFGNNTLQEEDSFRYLGSMLTND